jgi:hypothetical protein
MEFGMASAMSCYRRNQCRAKRIGPEHIKAFKIPEACLYGILNTFATVISELISINYRSGFKTSDQVQGQGVRPIGKAQHT